MAFSQDFQPGYIVKKGTKESGQISFLPTNKNQSSVHFRISSADTPQLFTTNEVDSFYLERSRAFFQKVIKDSIWIFSEVIVAGPATLLSHKSFFTIRIDSNELSVDKKRPTKTVANASSLRMTEIVLIGKIKNFLKECSDIRIRRITSQTIEDAVKNYNGCKGVEKNRIEKKGKLAVGLIAGVNLTYASTLDYGATYYNDNNLNPSITPRLGLTFDIIPGKYLKKAILTADIIYAPILFQSEKEVNDNQFLTKANMEIKTSAVRVPISLKIFQKYDRKGFFVNPGLISPTFYYKNESHRSRETRALSTGAVIAESESKNFVELRKFNIFSVFMGVGYSGTILTNTKLSILLRGEFETFTYDNSSDFYSLSLDTRIHF